MTDDTVTPKPKAIIPMGDASLVPGLKEEFTYTGDKGDYVIYSLNGGPLLETESFRLVLAKLPTGQLGLCKISRSVEENVLIEEEVETLRIFQKVASELDAEEEAKGEDHRGPHYGAQFPAPEEAMTSPDGREGFFFSFNKVVASYKELVPMSLVMSSKLINLRSGVWAFGKLLKLADFAHSLGYAISYLDQTNIFIIEKLHGVFVMNFMEAGRATAEEKLQDVVSIAKSVWAFCGGTETTDAPFRPGVMSEDAHAKFVSLYKRAMAGELTAAAAFKELYALADETWPHEPIKSGKNAGKMQRPWYDTVWYEVKTDKES